ncbi:hypothetical protein [Paractinoplanes brasiliensis]|uniref:hypothetical protein n=1 Tax=Paractinoplanes brasiliensis TaxID=52695 RepID=UPI00105E61B5|nr:hypothetical protein [Actinoplanes brasiliensis]
MTNWMTAAGIALIAGGLATLICFRTVLFGGDRRRSRADTPAGIQPKSRRARGNRRRNRAPDPALPPARALGPAEEEDSRSGLALIGLADDPEPAYADTAGRYTKDQEPFPYRAEPHPEDQEPLPYAVGPRTEDQEPFPYGVEPRAEDQKPFPYGVEPRAEDHELFPYQVEPEMDYEPEPESVFGPVLAEPGFEPVISQPVTAEPVMGEPAGFGPITTEADVFGPVMHEADVFGPLMNEPVKGGSASGGPAGFEPGALPASDAVEPAVGEAAYQEERYGHRVEGWVRPEYRHVPEEPPSGEYWTPIPVGLEPDPEPSAKGYGWPMAVERLPAAGDYEPPTGYDLVEHEPTEVVSAVPPARKRRDRAPVGDRANRIRLPRNWPARDDKYQEPAAREWRVENDSPPRRRRVDSTQRFAAVTDDPPAVSRRRPRPRPRPSAEPSDRSTTMYVSRHAAEPPPR